MTIKTMEYIHKLLLANYESANSLYCGARDRLNDMEDFELHLETKEARKSFGVSVSNQKEYVEDCWKKRCEASAALEDFESKEW